MMAREWAQRDKLTLRLPSRFLALQPGTRLDLDLVPRTWCVEQLTVDGYVVVAELRPSWSPSPSIGADAGRIVADVDEAEAEVTLALFDVPDLLEQGSPSPMLMLAASTATPRWKRYNVEIVVGQQRFQAQTASGKTLLGTASTALGPGSPYLIDEGGQADIELIDPDQWLTSCDDESLISGSNLAILGNEVLQFGSAAPLGEGRFRLSRLLRGRAGTEWAITTHVSGERFALVERHAMQPIALPSWTTGASVTASIAGLAGTTMSAPLLLSGESLRPWAPVKLKASLDDAGNLVVAWTRRSRKGFPWVDDVDVPLGESSEQYDVTITGPQGSIDVQTSERALEISATDIARVGPGPATVEVRQIGDAAASRRAEISLTI